MLVEKCLLRLVPGRSQQARLPSGKLAKVGEPAVARVAGLFRNRVTYSKYQSRIA